MTIQLNQTSDIIEKYMNTNNSKTIQGLLCPKKLHNWKINIFKWIISTQQKYKKGKHVYNIKQYVMHATTPNHLSISKVKLTKLMVKYKVWRVHDRQNFQLLHLHSQSCIRVIHLGQTMGIKTPDTRDDYLEIYS